MSQRHPSRPPSLVFADEHGQIRDYPGLLMAGRSGNFLTPPDLADQIPLPPCSELFVLPDRRPVGIDPANGLPVTVNQDPSCGNSQVLAVAAFMAPAHTAIQSAAYEKTCDKAQVLPLFAYTAVGWHQGKFWVSAFRSDPDIRQDASQFKPSRLQKNTRKILTANPANRLIQHLGKCCLTYGCPAARNYFLGRWEAPLPTSPVCNAACIGCISLQPSGCCPSTQDRITFVPTAAEITEIAVPHLNNATSPIVSFGQGCEGEPLLQAKTLAAAIKSIRSATSRGTINLNTNASIPESVATLARAGLDSIRVSLNSARSVFHSRYYRPKGFSLSDVTDSISIMKDNGRFVSLNYFILPGFTDDPDEFDAFCELVNTFRPDLIQLRNLNMDPDWYFESIGHQPRQAPMGIRNWHHRLQQIFPFLRYGYFNPPVR